MTFAQAFFLLALPAALLMAFPVTVLAQSGPDNVELGRDIAQKNCAQCHAIGRTGESTHKDAPPFRTIANRYPVWSLAEAFAEGITTGHPDMPEFVFESEDITSLLSYMETLEMKSDATEDK